MPLQLILLLTILITGLCSWAAADEFDLGIKPQMDADSFIKYRENLMSNARHYRKNINAILRGKVNADQHLLAQARALYDLSKMYADVFPEGSGVGDTRAKVEIWQNPADYREKLDKHVKATAELLQAVESGDKVSAKTALNKVGKSCTACHTVYRSKD